MEEGAEKCGEDYLKSRRLERTRRNFFRRAFRSFSEDFRPLDARLGARARERILLCLLGWGLAGCRGMRADLFPVINLRGLARATPAGGESRGVSQITEKTRRVARFSSSSLSCLLTRRLDCAPLFRLYTRVRASWWSILVIRKRKSNFSPRWRFI